MSAPAPARWGPEVIEKVNNPLVFNGDTTAVKSPPTVQVRGYDVSLLIDICKALALANSSGGLLHRRANVVVLGALGRLIPLFDEVL